MIDHGGLAVINTPYENDLRSLAILIEAFPASLDLQRLVYFDYFVVHSDDLPDGPAGLHPKTPHRSGELLVRRELLQAGLRLFASRDLIAEIHDQEGMGFRATEEAGGFLAALNSRYTHQLQDRARWVVQRFANERLEALTALVSEHLGEWGAEFEMESVLWSDSAT